VEVKNDSAKCYLDNVLIHAIVVGSKFLYSSCTIDSTNHDIFLKVVNFTNSDKTAAIILKNISENCTLEGSIETMTYTTPSSENSIVDPEKITPETVSFSSADTGFQYTFLQNSINIFHLFPQSPILQMDNETFSIPENSGNGSSAGYMNASGGSQFKYSLLKSSLKGAFEIDESTGEVIVSDSNLLNFETTSAVVLDIMAKDIQNDSVFPVRGTCTINLSDMNEKPVLLGNAYYTFTSDSTGASIGKIFMTDEDKGQNQSFSIYAQSEGNVLAIDPATGELTITDNNALQLLVSKTITFTVRVTDNGIPSLSDEKEYTLEVLEEPLLVSLPDAESLKDLEVYPNPATNEITVTFSENKGNLIINLVDNHGKIVGSKKASRGMTRFETSGLSNGIYYIQVLSDGRLIGVQNVALIK
jgi:hypothetical protein